MARATIQRAQRRFIALASASDCSSSMLLASLIMFFTGERRDWRGEGDAATTRPGPSAMRAGETADLETSKAGDFDDDDAPTKPEYSIGRAGFLGVL